jgi:hypothetical protein
MTYGNTVAQLNPLYKDTIDLGILEYFKSRNFERITVQAGVAGDASVAKLIENPNIHNYGELLTHFYSGYSSLHYVAIYYILIDFLGWSSDFLNFDNVILDIRALGFPTNMIPTIESHYQVHKSKFSSNQINNSKKEAIEEPKNVVIQASNNKKQFWIKAIAKADIHKVVDELIDFGIENDLDQFLILSNRWHSMQNDFHKGIMKRDDFELENNKIVQALLNFVKNIEDTEGSH